MEAHGLYERHVPAGKLDECSIVDKCGDFLGIHLTNRYFTSRPYAPHIPFDPSVDPSGNLTNLAKGQYFHDEQNVVKYNNRTVDLKRQSGKYPSLFTITYIYNCIARYAPLTPVRFRVGDIVEAKATLMLLPLRGGRFKLSAVLRSITLWDTQFTQVRTKPDTYRDHDGN